MRSPSVSSADTDEDADYIPSRNKSAAKKAKKASPQLPPQPTFRGAGAAEQNGSVQEIPQQGQEEAQSAQARSSMEVTLTCASCKSGAEMFDRSQSRMANTTSATIAHCPISGQYFFKITMKP